jgi:hypothetical protein
MTVGQLKELLGDQNDDQEIRFEVPTNNYWRNVKAIDINRIEEVQIKFSEYTKSYIIVEESDEESEKEYKTCLLIT